MSTGYDGPAPALTQDAVQRVAASGQPASFLPGGFALASARKANAWDGTELFGGTVKQDANRALDARSWFGSPGLVGIQDRMVDEEPTLQAMRLAITLPLLGDAWRMEAPTVPTPQEQEATDFAELALFEHLDCDDGWHGWIEQAVQYQWRGFLPSELFWPYDREMKRTLLGLRPLMPKTVREWSSTPDGWELKQWPATGDMAKGRGWRGTVLQPDEYINLRYMPKGSSPAPMGAFRPAYADWMASSNMRVLEAQGWQRAAYGVPTIKVDPTAPGFDDAQSTIDAVNLAAKNYRSGLLAAQMMPPGYEMIFQDFPFRGEELGKAILAKRHSMLMVVLATFLRTGETKGALALHDGQVAFFTKSLQQAANKIARVLSRYVVKRLIAKNFPAVRRFPAVKAPEIRIGDPAALVEAIVGALDKGAVVDSDRAVEDRIREVLSAPPRPEPAAGPLDPDEGGGKTDKGDPEDEVDEETAEEQGTKPKGDDEPEVEAGERPLFTAGGIPTYLRWDNIRDSIVDPEGQAELDRLLTEFKERHDPAGDPAAPPIVVLDGKVVARAAGMDLRSEVENAPESPASVPEEEPEPVEPTVDTPEQVDANAANVGASAEEGDPEAIERYADDLLSASDEDLDRLSDAIDEAVADLLAAERHLRGPSALRYAERVKRLNEDQPTTGPRGRALRACEEVVRLSETVDRTYAGKTEQVRIIDDWRKRIAEPYAAEVSKAADLPAVARAPVPGQKELVGALSVNLRAAYRSGQASVRNEIDRIEADPDLRKRIERGDAEVGGDGDMPAPPRLSDRCGEGCGCTREVDAYFVDMTLAERMTVAGACPQPDDSLRLARKRTAKAPTPNPDLPASDIDDIDPEDSIYAVARTTVDAAARRVSDATALAAQGAGEAGVLPASSVLAEAVAGAVLALAPSGDKHQAQADVNDIFGLGRRQEQRAEVDPGWTFMYSALLESASCDSCLGHDGETFGADQLDEYRTPASWCEAVPQSLCNCLTIAVPPAG